MGRLIVAVLQFMRKYWKTIAGALGPILSVAVGWRLKGSREKLKEERLDKSELEKQLRLDVEDAKDEGKSPASEFTSHFGDSG